jgi:hypothetical protein
VTSLLSFIQTQCSSSSTELTAAGVTPLSNPMKCLSIGHAQTLPDVCNTRRPSRRAGSNRTLRRSQMCIHVVDFVCMYNGVQLKSKLLDTGTWPPATWPPRSLYVIAQQCSSAFISISLFFTNATCNSLKLRNLKLLSRRVSVQPVCIHPCVAPL